MKKQTIGFDRELQLNWLDTTAGFVREGFDLPIIRQRLQTLLTNTIPGQDSRRKTVTVLTRLWARVPAEHYQLQQEALQLLIKLPSAERLWLHWGMSILAYPFFFDVASTIGQLLTLQGVFETSQVRRRMWESWGQRSTLDRAINRVIQTFTLWNIIKQTNSSPRRYSANTVVETSNAQLTTWLLACTLHAYHQSVSFNRLTSLPLGTLINAPAIFPFGVDRHIVSLRKSLRFEIGYQGMNLEYVSLNVS